MPKIKFTLLTLLLSFLSWPQVVFAQTPATVSVDFSQPPIQGSPLIFGGASLPPLDHQDAWNKLADMGATFIRQDLFIQDFIPNTTIANYKNNIDGIQDPKNWNQTAFAKVKNEFTNSNSRHMQTLWIVSYAPPWLTYSNTQFGVIADWWVWQDMLTKIFTRLANDGVLFNYLEVWNEPGITEFLDLAGSPYSSPIPAYLDLYFHTASTIRAIEPTALVGGPADYRPKPAADMITALLADSRTLNLVDFVSYHYYDNLHSWEIGPLESDKFIRQSLSGAARENLPVFLTEYTRTCCGAPGTNGETSDISYVGDKFIWMLKNGLTGANYYSFTPWCEYQGQCIYAWQNGQALLKPQARAWRLASVQLKLGNGPSRVFPTRVTGNLQAIGAVNSNAEPVLLLSNIATEDQVVTVSIKGLITTNPATITTFLASATNDATRPLSTSSPTLAANVYTHTFSLPAQSVMGLRLYPSATISDLKVLITSWGEPGTFDLNSDHKTNTFDYALFINR